MGTLAQVGGGDTLQRVRPAPGLYARALCDSKPGADFLEDGLQEAPLPHQESHCALSCVGLAEVGGRGRRGTWSAWPLPGMQPDGIL